MRKIIVTVAPVCHIGKEIPAECKNPLTPEEIAEEVAQTIYNCMVKAGSIFCTRCKLDADVSRNQDGSLPDHWIH